MMMHGENLILNLKLRETTYLIRCKNSQPGCFGVYLLFLPEGGRASLQNVTFLECCILIRQWTKSN